ncbi:hypothetical protein NGM10_04650 [Halorussus salilacus]|uniref:hypothetical protein n=1 Tax=Halorussus salilacus TaxID=2953750 RepID=UPI0020A065E0|nr:hypothetical protein [Halorussus salilacus]USZ69029.1 hypothetical protein NGM10_04650 [Halorussus salilacus]
MDELGHLALFLVGFLLIVGGFVVGIGAFEYEVVALEEVEGSPDGIRFVENESHTFSATDTTIVRVEYESLSERDREMLDRVLAGERVVLRTRGQLPGKYGTKGRFAVERDGTTHLVDRRLFFNWRTPFGAASLAMGAVGLAAMSEAIRRRHFPHRSVFWTRR